MHSIGHRIYRSGDVEVDPGRRVIRLGGEAQSPRPRTFDLLVYLIQHRDRVVPREELLQQLWQGTSVTSNSLTQCVNEARKALGDDPRESRFIRTVAKSGYQFIAPIDEEGGYLEEVTTVQVEYEDDRPALWIRWAAAAAVVLLIAGSILYWRTRSAPQPDGAIIVLPFENSTAAADLDWLREGLPDMLITNLSRSPGMNVLGREQVRTILAGQQTPRAFDTALAWGRAHQAAVVISGSFGKLGDKVRVAAQVYRISNGSLQTSEGFLAERPEQILTYMDLTSLKLASVLGRPIPQQDRLVGLSSLMTPSLEAYRYYALGLERADALHPAEAIDLFRKATELDPNFAMAHARIGYTYTSIWARPLDAKPSLETAFRLSNRLTPPDRLHIAAWYALANFDYPAAIKAYQALIANNPRDVEAYTRLGSLLGGERRTKEAVDALQQALVIDPNSATTWNVLSGVQVRADLVEGATVAARRYVALSPNEPNAWDTLGMALHAAGNTAESEKAYRQALSLKPGFTAARIHLANVVYQEGRYQEALRNCGQFLEDAKLVTEKTRGHACLAAIYVRMQQPAKAEQEVLAMLQTDPRDTFYPAMYYLERGDRARAVQLAQISAPSADRGRRSSARTRLVLLGRIALAEGRTNEALELFGKALEEGTPLHHMEWYEDCLGDAYFELGRHAEAAAEYERVLAKYPSMTLVRYRLATAYERVGKPDQARTEYKRFLADWKRADPDNAEIAVARKF